VSPQKWARGRAGYTKRVRGRDTETWDHPPGLDSLLFAPLGLLYAVGWLAYESIYTLGLKHAMVPDLPTICVGNRRVGGSGKTPLTLYVADRLRQLGQPVIVGMSGYGSPAARDAQIAPPGDLDPSEMGDEPSMARFCFPDLPLVIGRDRVRAAQLAAEAFSDHVLVMDDGFQHLRLAPHLRLLIDPPGPNPWCLPAGPYREPIRGRRRADLVLPSAEYRLVSSGVRLWNVDRTRVTPAELPDGVDALCALARPWRFGAGLEALGLKVHQGRWQADHDPLTRPRLLDGLGIDRPLVVTAKDWVKLRQRDDLGTRRVLIADYTLSVDPESTFMEFVHNRLRAVRSRHSA